MHGDDHRVENEGSVCVFDGGLSHTFRLGRVSSAAPVIWPQA